MAEAARTPGKYDEMDRDELLQEINELRRTVDDLKDTVDVASQATWDVVDSVYGEYGSTVGSARIDSDGAILDRLEALEGTVEDLEDENERLRARLDDGADGKDGKVAAIVEYADNARNSAPAVKLTYKEIVGATGCSPRYAYDLMDRLPTEYDWFLTPQEMTQYGSIELDNTDDRRLGIDFEGVHSSGCPLNKFNNAERSMGGSE